MKGLKDIIKLIIIILVIMVNNLYDLLIYVLDILRYTKLPKNFGCYKDISWSKQRLVLGVSQLFAKQLQFRKHKGFSWRIDIA